MMNMYLRSSSGICSSYGWLLVAALVPWVLAQNRTTVQLEYQLDVNFTSSIPTVESAVIAVEATTKSLLLNLMSKNLGATSSSDSVILQSSLQDPCWDSAVPSDACYTISTKASILVPSNINPALVTLATTNQKVQAIWMNDVEQAYPNVIRVASLPTTPSTSNQLDASLTIVLHNVSAGRIMDDYEIAVFEETVMRLLVVGARNFNFTYFSLHSVTVDSQTLVPSSTGRLLLRQLQSGSFNNVVNTTVTGHCNQCGQATNLFNDAVGDTPGFRKKLQQNGQGNGGANSTGYFNSVSSTSVSVSSLSGSGLHASDNNGAASATSSTTSSDGGQSGAPMALWFILAACVGLVVVILVVLLVLAGRRRRRRAEAEEEMEGEEVEEKDYRHEHRRHSQYNNKPSDDVTDEDDVY